MFGALEKIGKEVVMVYFKVLSQQLPQSVSWPRFKLGICQIQVRSVNGCFVTIVGGRGKLVC
jgi:hypothetical protein